MVSGRAPFSGSTLVVVHAHAYDPPDFTVLPAALRPVVGRGLAQDPAARCASAGALAQALRRRLGEASGDFPARAPHPITGATTARPLHPHLGMGGGRVGRQVGRGTRNRAGCARWLRGRSLSAGGKQCQSHAFANVHGDARHRSPGPGLTL
jgi:hypothetical protein